jgi:pSer/pThr/pTyr-binding forkhead associated (FHA) protein
MVYSGEQRIFYSFGIKDSPIILGRGKDCKVRIESTFLSKKHTTIEYNKEVRVWQIRDGDENKPSLNGTWLLLDTKHELKDENFIKIGNNVIRMSFES